MSDDRKYRQPGYQDRGEPRREKHEKKDSPRPAETFGPRALRMPGKRSLSRCSNCGVILQALAEPLGQCPKCQAELHSCKQCTHFDPASRFECTQPIVKRIAQKDARNQCQFFSLRVRVERDTTAGAAAQKPDDARRAFDNLFKK